MNVLEIERDALRLVEQIERDIATIQESAEKAQLEMSVLQRGIEGFDYQRKLKRCQEKMVMIETLENQITIKVKEGQVLKLKVMDMKGEKERALGAQVLVNEEAFGKLPSLVANARQALSTVPQNISEENLEENL